LEVSEDPALRDFKSLGSSANQWVPNYVDIREDRVVFFGSIGVDAEQFTYRIKAVSPGEFTVPPAFVEDMYEKSIQARGLAGKMRVRAR
jgi:uncharacterized protein YfaS (alpha-2-macroglobulin family)